MTEAQFIAAKIADREAAARVRYLKAELAKARAELARLDASNLAAARAAEVAADVAKAPDSFAAYWAGSASQSVMNDYKAGRFTRS